MLELLMLAGFYRTVSYLTNGLRLPLESAGVRFPGRGISLRGAEADVCFRLEAGITVSLRRTNLRWRSH